MWKLLCPLLIGCAYEGRLPATYFGETSDVLQAGHVAITGAGGLGLTVYGAGEGGGVRARVGVGGGQEVGVEAAGISFDAARHTCSIDCDPNDNGSFVEHGESALVSWKLRLGKVAWIAGVGASRHAPLADGPSPTGDFQGHSVDATLGFVARGRGPFYIGMRGAIAVPLHAMQAAPILEYAGAIGIMHELSPQASVFVEAGPHVAMPADAGLFVEGDAGVTIATGLRFEL